MHVKLKYSSKAEVIAMTMAATLFLFTFEIKILIF